MHLVLVLILSYFHQLLNIQLPYHFWFIIIVAIGNQVKLCWMINLIHKQISYITDFNIFGSDQFQGLTYWIEKHVNETICWQSKNNYGWILFSSSNQHLTFAFLYIIIQCLDHYLTSQLRIITEFIHWYPVNSVMDHDRAENIWIFHDKLYRLDLMQKLNCYFSIHRCLQLLVWNFA